MSFQKLINSAKLNIHFGQEIESAKMKNIKLSLNTWNVFSIGKPLQKKSET